jgi:hypothetical protein
MSATFPFVLPMVSMPTDPEFTLWMLVFEIIMAEKS